VHENMSAHERLAEYVESVRIVDTHEHVTSPHRLKETGRSLLDLVFAMLLRDDLQSLGLARTFWRLDLSQEEKWLRLKPYLEQTRNTSYFEVLRVALHDLYGIKGDPLAQDWRHLSDLVEETVTRGAEWYDFVLKKKSNVEYCLVDKGRTTDFENQIWNSLTSGDNQIKESPESSGYEPFLPVLRIDMFAFAYKPGGTGAIQEKFGVKVTTFGEYEEFLKKLVSGLRASGFMALKSCLGYFGGLDYTNPYREKAAKAWSKGQEADAEEQQCFRDYVVWLLSQLAGLAGLTFSMHTGSVCCGAPFPEKCGVKELLRLIQGNPETKFDLFHAGYPCTGEGAAIVKYLPNAYLNLSWLPMVSQSMMRRYLLEILDEIPMNKITWGGDAEHVEEVYSNVKMMREILVSVLSEKFGAGRYDFELCEQIAKRVLRENAIRIYDLPVGEKRTGL